MEQDKKTMAGELSRRADDQSRRVQAGAKTREERKFLQVTRADDWAKFLQSHWQRCQVLRAQAAAKPNGQTACTMCDGRGSLDSCFLCAGTGKCPACQGTGKHRPGNSELCPTCVGTGKCYLCAGTGNMICPFCDDGIVDIHAPPPPSLLPLVPPPFQP
jgi:DnaJ-class molecular chaperone